MADSGDDSDRLFKLHINNEHVGRTKTKIRGVGQNDMETTDFDSDESQDWSLDFDKDVFQRLDDVRRKMITGSERTRVRDFIRMKRDSVKTKAKEITKKVHSKVDGIRRKVITGSSTKRVRDYLNETPVVKKTDQISFTIGVLIANVAQYVVVAEPYYFGNFFLGVMIPTLLLRYYLYKREKWHYFLLDFCYAVQLLCMIDFFFPTTTMRQVLYIYAHGPIAFAIPIWRNCVVFHSMDKMVSTFVHFFPALLMYVYRWHPRENEREIICGPNPDACTLDMNNYLYYSVLGYFLWQVLYLIKTEFFDGQIMLDDPTLYTSMKWHTRKKGTPTARIFLKILRKMGIMSRDEIFDSTETKTKVTFALIQFLFTILTGLPTIFMFNNKWVNAAWLGSLYLLLLWNGAAYYIEVFASTYMRKFQKSIDAMEEKLKQQNENAMRDRDVDSGLDHTEQIDEDRQQQNDDNNNNNNNNDDDDNDDDDDNNNNKKDC